MGMPKSILIIDENGVQLKSNVRRAKYSLEELTRAALRDIGRYINHITHDDLKKIADGVLQRSNRIQNSYQYWNRKRETDLLVGIKHDTWYGVEQELGMNGQPKRDILRKAVFSNVQTIIEIQSKYLKHIEDELAAERLINENDEGEDQGGR